MKLRRLTEEGLNPASSLISFSMVGFNSVHCLKFFSVKNNQKTLLFATRAFAEVR